jgi:hypothetical protein
MCAEMHMHIHTERDKGERRKKREGVKASVTSLIVRFVY